MFASGGQMLHQQREPSDVCERFVRENGALFLKSECSRATGKHHAFLAAAGTLGFQAEERDSLRAYHLLYMKIGCSYICFSLCSFVVYAKNTRRTDGGENFKTLS